MSHWRVRLGVDSFVLQTDASVISDASLISDASSISDASAIDDTNANTESRALLYRRRGSYHKGEAMGAIQFSCYKLECVSGVSFCAVSSVAPRAGTIIMPLEHGWPCATATWGHRSIRIVRSALATSLLSFHSHSRRASCPRLACMSN
jgi:hypothetical protein